MQSSGWWKELGGPDGVLHDQVAMFVKDCMAEDEMAMEEKKMELVGKIITVMGTQGCLDKDELEQ